MNYRPVFIWIIVLTCVFAFAFLIIFLTKTTTLSTELPIDSDIFANYAVVVSGIAGTIISVFTIYLLVQTLTDQRIQGIDVRFFELLKIHRENAYEIALIDRTGAKVFITLLREFYESLRLVSVVVSTRKDELTENDILNIAYLCFFFGVVGDNSERLIRDNISKFDTENDKDFCNNLINFFINNQRSVRERERFDFNPFEGHQVRLSRYFRHLFQTIKYINKQPAYLLNYAEKYEYLKTLRAQLSTQEAALFFFNSLSDLGMPWEKQKGLEINQQLITKYNLLKNIPSQYIAIEGWRKYYPLIHYEGEPKKSNKRINLEKKYS